MQQMEVLCSLAESYLACHAPCSQEESDTLLLQVADAAQKGCKKVTICTVDTDVAVQHIGPTQCLTLPVLHAFTKCDTVSAFVGRGKKTAWETLKSFPEVNDAFDEYAK